MQEQCNKCRYRYGVADWSTGEYRQKFLCELELVAEPNIPCPKRVFMPAGYVRDLE